MLDGAPVGTHWATKITSNYSHHDTPKGVLGEITGK